MVGYNRPAPGSELPETCRCLNCPDTPHDCPSPGIYGQARDHLQLAPQGVKDLGHLWDRTFGHSGRLVGSRFARRHKSFNLPFGSPLRRFWGDPPVSASAAVFLLPIVL